jgi:hypothetical protein
MALSCVFALAGAGMALAGTQPPAKPAAAPPTKAEIEAALALKAGQAPTRGPVIAGDEVGANAQPCIAADDGDKGA